MVITDKTLLIMLQDLQRQFYEKLNINISTLPTEDGIIFGCFVSEGDDMESVNFFTTDTAEERESKYEFIRDYIYGKKDKA